MKDDVCILIPTLNEGKTIGTLIKEFKSLGYNNILVIDGHSKDNTAKIARNAGAKVVIQSGKGKGQAVKQAFDLIDSAMKRSVDLGEPKASSEYVVMIDGDGTYLPSDIDIVLAPVLKGEADHVIGNRFKEYEKGAFTKLNLIGNQLLNKIFGFAYGVWLNDILSGYRAFTKNTIKQLELNKTGFEVEAEITIESVKKNLRITEVPITYLSRKGMSATKLNPLKDGFKIGYTIYKLAKTHNPLFYFGVIGAIFLISGIGIGIYIVQEWFKGIDHIPLTILATILIISGFQLFIFGLIGDLIASLHKELMRAIKEK